MKNNFRNYANLNEDNLFTPNNRPYIKRKFEVNSILFKTIPIQRGILVAT
jgi:hypothetical protein